MKTLQEIKDEVAQNNGLWCGWYDSDVTDEMRVGWFDEIVERYANEKLTFMKDVRESPFL